MNGVAVILGSAVNLIGTYTLRDFLHVVLTNSFF